MGFDFDMLSDQPAAAMGGILLIKSGTVTTTQEARSLYKRAQPGSEEALSALRAELLLSNTYQDVMNVYIISKDFDGTDDASNVNDSHFGRIEFLALHKLAHLHQVACAA